MNIFYLHPDATKCAEYHVDKHVVKMILEYAQLLSTAHRVVDGVNQNKHWLLEDYREDVLYKATHVNHPSSIWTRESASNYLWLHKLFVELTKEFKFRYGKDHKTSRLINELKYPPVLIPDKEFSQPKLAMPSCYHEEDAVNAYRNYYIFEKNKLFKWKNREVPEWIFSVKSLT